MSQLSPLQSSGYLYRRIIGTGGIGSGLFFALENNETIGRNESRLGKLLPVRDYCKQHIILHYVAVLLGAGKPGGIEVHPIGKVGDDSTGKSLIQEMQSAGMKTQHVTVESNSPTLLSVCFQYPDTSGGNLTAANSACSLLTESDIDAFFKQSNGDGAEIILSVPEVPLQPRLRLLEYGRERKSLNIVSILSEEVQAFKDAGGFQLTDMLFINIDEAESISSLVSHAGSKKEMIQNCVEILTGLNPSISVLITDGSNGVYVYCEKRLSHIPSLKVVAVSTAGAGDAFVAGTICGLCCGLPLVSSNPEKDQWIQSAAEMGILVAAYSVLSADTINFSLNAESLLDFADSLRNISVNRQ